MSVWNTPKIDWDPSDTVSEDNLNEIGENLVYLFPSAEASFTANFYGFSSDPQSVTCYYRKYSDLNGSGPDIAEIYIPSVNAISNQNYMKTLSGVCVPVDITPSSNIIVSCVVKNAGQDRPGGLRITTGRQLEFLVQSGGVMADNLFSASSTKGFTDLLIKYPLF